MNIGSVTLANPLVFAPLAGITNLPLRLQAKSFGCGLVCSEMISANGLVYKSGRTETMLESNAAEKPLSVQIFGADPAIMAEAATMVEASGADILDINFGCSVRKVVKTGSGAALMRTPALARRIFEAVRRAIRIPLTIKIRSGWDASGEQALEIAGIAEAAGIDAIAVHPRTARQGFGGTADWSLIRRVREAVGIPVIGNGDVTAPADAVRMMTETGCDGVMIGRAAFGNPWLFQQTLDLMAGRPVTPVSLAERFQTMSDYVRESVKYLGEERACRMMRSRLGWFVKGLRDSSRFREDIKMVDTEADALAHIRRYRRQLIGVTDG
jgi:nifR3 family TIM-barrel protein